MNFLSRGTQVSFKDRDFGFVELDNGSDVVYCRFWNDITRTTGVARYNIRLAPNHVPESKVNEAIWKYCVNL